MPTQPAQPVKEQSFLEKTAIAIGKELVLWAANKLTDKLLESDVLSKTGSDYIEDLLGRNGPTLGSLKTQLDELHSGQEHISAQIETLRTEIRLNSRQIEANNQEMAILNFLDTWAKSSSLNRRDLAQKRRETLHVSQGVYACVNNYHLILTYDNGESPGLLKAMVDYYWRMYEQGLEGQGLQLDLVETCKRIAIFRNETIALQLIGLRLAADMADTHERRKNTIEGVLSKLAMQAATLKDLLPSCVDLSSDNFDEFLTRSEFHLESVEYPGQYLTTGYEKWYRTFLWSDDKLQVIPFVWNHKKPNANLTNKNRKIYDWKVRKGNDRFFQLIGYSVEWLQSDREFATLYNNPLEVDIRWESNSKGRVEKFREPREVIEGERGRYTARWAGDRLWFKIILLRSKMANMTDDPIIRFVDKDWGDSRSTQSTFCNSVNPTNTYKLQYIVAA